VIVYKTIWVILLYNLYSKTEYYETKITATSVLTFTIVVFSIYGCALCSYGIIIICRT